jgi:hypothetical protein
VNKNAILHFILSPPLQVDLGGMRTEYIPKLSAASSGASTKDIEPEMEPT